MHHGWILSTPSWVEAARHIHTQTHTDFLLSDTKLHNRQKEFTATPASRVLPLLRARGRCPELSGPVQNGHEQSFREHSHFLLISVVLTQVCSLCRNSSSWTLRSTLFCAFRYEESSAQIQVTKMTVGGRGGTGQDWEFGTGASKRLYRGWTNRERSWKPWEGQ